MIFGRRRPKPSVLFSTHTPGEWTEPGQHYVRDGVEYVITGIKPLAPTRLITGGSHACWDVYGLIAGVSANV